MDNNKENVNHIYDGIVEQNNPMPSWWVWTFILTMIFGFLYWLHYTFGGGPTLQDEYKAELATYEAKAGAAGATAATETEETLEKYFKGETALLNGAKLYKEKCSMCHGDNLEGKIGPNLTDNFWINGKGSRLDIFHVAQKGVPAKGMPPWGGILKPNELKDVAAFVHSKIGSNPANAKAAEGNEVK